MLVLSNHEGLRDAGKQNEPTADGAHPASRGLSRKFPTPGTLGRLHPLHLWNESKDLQLQKCERDLLRVKQESFMVQVTRRERPRLFTRVTFAQQDKGRQRVDGDIRQRQAGERFHKVWLDYAAISCGTRSGREKPGREAGNGWRGRSVKLSISRGRFCKERKSAREGGYWHWEWRTESPLYGRL
jgi:hypothetical protein